MLCGGLSHGNHISDPGTEKQVCSIPRRTIDRSLRGLHYRLGSIRLDTFHRLDYCLDTGRDRFYTLGNPDGQSLSGAIIQVTFLRQHRRKSNQIYAIKQSDQTGTAKKSLDACAFKRDSVLNSKDAGVFFS